LRIKLLNLEKNIFQNKVSHLMKPDRKKIKLEKPQLIQIQLMKW